MAAVDLHEAHSKPSLLSLSVHRAGGGRAKLRGGLDAAGDVRTLEGFSFPDFHGTGVTRSPSPVAAHDQPHCRAEPLHRALWALSPMEKLGPTLLITLQTLHLLESCNMK